MTEIIYDVLEDESRIENMAIRAKEKRKPLVNTNYGYFGTKLWWDRVCELKLLKVEEGIITDLVFTGHGDFPEFVVRTESTERQFGRKGEERKYTVGARVRLTMISTQEVIVCSDRIAQPLMGKFTLLRVELLGPKGLA